MAVHNEEVQEMHSGFTKGIEESAVGLIMENLQRYQYQYPIKSTVREIVCNGIDSVADKNVALQILDGAPVENFFEEKEGPLYQDSKWDPTYYDPQWLSDDDKVYITYIEGENQEKNSIVIQDFGTGLGGKRLRGYFNLGWSTKRLSKLPLGKFGIGAKSALSVGVKFYTMESRYNGMKFRFNIYSSSVDSIVPSMNLETGAANPFVLFGEHKVHYLPTQEKNGVTVTIEAKKHHKQQYIDAVKTQLLYFQNIEFNVIDEGGRKNLVEYKAGIIYEDDFIVLSDNKMWSKPHLLLNKVNYGYIDWEELEMTPKNGNIGIKVDPSDIEVNPSRESVIWSETTKEMVAKRFKNVVDIATDFVQKEMEETDFVRWIRVCMQLNNNHSGTSIVARLANIIDLSEVRPHFPPDQSIRFGTNIFQCFSMRFFNYAHKTKAGKNMKKVDREDIESITYHSLHPIVLMDEVVSVRKDKYLLQKVYNNGFVGIRAPKWIDDGYNAESLLTEDALVQLNIGFTEFGISSASHASIKNAKSNVRSAAALWEWLQKSAEVVMYSDIEVPEDFVCDENDEEEVIETEEDEVVAKEAAVSAEDRRRVEGKTVLFTPRYSFGYRDRVNDDTKFYSFDKKEVKVSEISEWDQEEIFYGCDEDMETMHLAAFLTRDPSAELNNVDVRDYHWYGSQLRIIKVAQSNRRMYRDFKHISKFFLDVKNGKLFMSNALIRWNTARLLGVKLKQLAYLWNYEVFDKEKADKFAVLVQYVRDNYNEVEYHAHSKYGVTQDAYKALIQHLDNVQQFQIMVEAGASSEDVAAVATQMFGNPKVQDAALAVDPEIWASFTELMEYSGSISPLLNEIRILTGLPQADTLDEDDDPDDVAEETDKYLQFVDRIKLPIPAKVEQEIRGFLQWKGVS